MKAAFHIITTIAGTSFACTTKLVGLKLQKMLHLRIFRLTYGDILVDPSTNAFV
jgi:hypothetical protein